MNIIDKYIFKRYIFMFFFILLSFIFIFIIINWIDNNDKFVRNNAPLKIVLKYYYYNIPYVINIVISVCSLLAALLTFSGFGKYNELIALQVSGVSRIRIISSVIIAAFVISILLFFFNEFITVPFNKKRLYTYDVEIYHERDESFDIKYNDIRRVKNNAIIQIGQYNPADSVMSNFNIQYFNNFDVLIKRIDADTVKWVEGRGWKLEKPLLRNIKEKNTKINYIRYDTLYIKELDFSPDDFVEKEFKPGKMERFLTLKEMNRFAKKQTEFGQVTYVVDYEIFNTFFYPFSIFFMTFIGSMLGSIYSRGGLMGYFFLCIFFCLIYITIIIVGKVLGQSNSIPPLLGALLPHIITSLVLFFLTKRT